METIKIFFSNQRTLWIMLGLFIVALIVAIGLVLNALIGPTDKQTDQSTNSSNSGTNLSSGNVSKLKGSTSSYRNLKGLTLRINQLETCDPDSISAYVAVSSDDGIVNRNFDKEDIKIYLDDKQIKDFTFNTVNVKKNPLANILAIDHSGSMTPSAMDNAKAAASSYIDRLQPDDQVGIIQFDDQIEVVQGVTRDKQAAKNAVSSIQPRGNTSLYDGIAKAISLTPQCGRKAVTVLTDGEDTTSVSNTLNTVIEQSNRTNLPVFSVGIKGSQFNPANIKQISDSTGGQYLEANTPEEVTSLYSNIDGQLQGQFVANLKLSLSKTGESHKLRIVSDVEGSPTSSERTFVY